MNAICTAASRLFGSFIAFRRYGKACMGLRRRQRSSAFSRLHMNIDQGVASNNDNESNTQYSLLGRLSRNCPTSDPEVGFDTNSAVHVS